MLLHLSSGSSRYDLLFPLVNITDISKYLQIFSVLRIEPICILTRNILKSLLSQSFSNKCIIKHSLFCQFIASVILNPSRPSASFLLKNELYRFSAFWLRSSVVSVLVSLVSDTSSIRGQYIGWIFGAGSWNRSLLRPLHASTWYCSTSSNGAPKKKIKKKKKMNCNAVCTVSQ